MPGISKTRVMVSKTWWAKHIHDTSSSRGPRVAISQSSTATGSKSSYMTLPIRESPQQSTASSVSGRLASSHASARSVIGDRPMSGTAKSYQARTWARLRASARVARVVGVEEGERRGRVGDPVQPGDDVDGGVLQPPLVGDRGVVQPVVAEVVGHHVLRHHAVDAVHQEERRAQHVARLLHPPHGGHGHVGQLAGDPHRVVLVAQRVAREDRHVLLCRSDPGDVRAGTLLAVLGPGRVEHEGLRRHAVGVDAAVQRHLGVGPGGQLSGQPFAQESGKRGRVAARPLQLELGWWGGLGHPASISGTCSSCQRPHGASWWASKRRRFTVGPSS